MIGAFVGYFLVSLFKMNSWRHWFLAMIASSLTACFINRLAYRPLRSSPRLASFITALGASTFLRYLAALLWEPHSRGYPQTINFKVLVLHLGQKRIDHQYAAVVHFFP